MKVTESKGSSREIHPICTRGCDWVEFTHTSITTHSEAHKGKICLVHGKEEMEEPPLTQSSPHHHTLTHPYRTLNQPSPNPHHALSSSLVCASQIT